MSLSVQRNAINAKLAVPSKVMVARRPAILRAAPSPIKNASPAPVASCGDCRRKKGGKRQ